MSYDFRKSLYLIVLLTKMFAIAFVSEYILKIYTCNEIVNRSGDLNMFKRNISPRWVALRGMHAEF